MAAYYHVLDDMSFSRRWYLGAPVDSVGNEVDPRMIAHMVIDAERARPHPLFRLAGWEIAIICSEEVRSELARCHYSGLDFQPLDSTATAST